MNHEFGELMGKHSQVYEIRGQASWNSYNDRKVKKILRKQNAEEDLTEMGIKR